MTSQDSNVRESVCMKCGTKYQGRDGCPYCGSRESVWMERGLAAEGPSSRDALQRILNVANCRVTGEGCGSSDPIELIDHIRRIAIDALSQQPSDVKP